jgi:hypothetical protein
MIKIGNSLLDGSIRMTVVTVTPACVNTKRVVHQRHLSHEKEIPATHSARPGGRTDAASWHRSHVTGNRVKRVRFISDRRRADAVTSRIPIRAV